MLRWEPGLHICNISSFNYMSLGTHVFFFQGAYLPMLLKEYKMGSAWMDSRINHKQHLYVLHVRRPSGPGAI